MIQTNRSRPSRNRQSWPLSRILLVFAFFLQVLSNPNAQVHASSVNDDVLIVKHVLCDSPVIDGGLTAHLTDQFTLHWLYTPDDDLFEGTLVYHGRGWVGLGFSPDGKMVGAKAIIGLPNNISQNVKLYSLIGQSNNNLHDTMQYNDDGTLVHGLTGVVYQGDDGDTALSFVVKNFSKLSQPDESGHHTMLFAAGSSNIMGFHKYSDNFRLRLLACGMTSSTKSTNTTSTVSTYNHQAAFAAHGFFATLALAVITPFALSAAWFRALMPKWWIYVHVFSNCLSFFLTLIAIAVAFGGMVMRGQESPSNERHMSLAHHWIGLVIFLLMLAQVLNGLVRPRVETKADPIQRSRIIPVPKSRPEPDERKRRYLCDRIPLPQTRRERWHTLHRIVAFLIVTLAVFQLYSGLQLYTTQYSGGTQSAMIVYWLWVAFLFVLFLSFKCYLNVKLRQEDSRYRRPPQQNNLMPQRGEEEGHEFDPAGYDDTEVTDFVIHEGPRPYTKSREFSNII